MNLLKSSRCALSVCVAAMLVGCGGSQALIAPATPTQNAALREAAAGRALGRRDEARYEIVILPGLGGNFTQGNAVNDRGLIAGFASFRDNSAVHAVLWRNLRKLDLGTLGGPNSAVDFPLTNNTGELTGFSEDSQTDPYSENFCNFPATYNPTHICLGFRWKNGVMTALPTLGGNNDDATGENGSRQVVGFAETQKDPSCGAPQVFDIEGTIWEPNGDVVALPPYAGDPVSGAFGINDRGDVVGTSGTCGPLSNIGNAVHALLWKHRKRGSPIDLGNLGGAVFNAGFNINGRDQIVGISGIPGSGAFHAFLWQEGKMSDLGTLPGGVFSLPNKINDKGQVVGFSIDASGNNTAFIWEDGSMKDLNSLVPPNSRLHLMIASDINDRGWIVGDALDSKTGITRGILLIPSHDAALGRGGIEMKISRRPVSMEFPRSTF